MVRDGAEDPVIEYMFGLVAAGIWACVLELSDLSSGHCDLEFGTYLS